MLKSTEIVIEQLIIGLLTLVIVDLFVWGAVLPQLELGDDAYQSFFYGVLIVIVAYAAGIVVDRWSDTLMEQLERRIRIKVYRPNGKTPPDEPFLRIEIHKFGDRIADYHDYLRRRMRITRALTCIMPALFLAIALLEYDCQNQEFMRRAAGVGVFLFYFLLLIINIIKRPEKLFKIPKTHDKIRWDKFKFRYYCDPGIIGLVLFTLLGTVGLFVLRFMFGLPSISRVLLFIGGLLLTYMIGWAWWRISRTFFSFISSYEKFGRWK
jgi:hypothetical protein